MIDTDIIYNKIESHYRAGYMLSVETELRTSGVSDPRGELIREFSYTYADASKVKDGWDELAGAIMQRHDPHYAAVETEGRLALFLHTDRRSVHALAIRLLEAWFLNLDDAPTSIAGVNEELLSEVGRFAAYVYGSAEQLFHHYLIDDVTATERALRLALSERQLGVWYTLLHLDIEMSEDPVSMQVAEWMHKVKHEETE